MFKYNFKKELFKLVIYLILILFQYPIFLVISSSKDFLNLISKVYKFSSLDSKYVPDLFPFPLFIILTSLFALVFIILVILIFIIYIFNFKITDPKWFHTSIQTSFLLIIILCTIIFANSELKYQWVLSFFKNIQNNYTPGDITDNQPLNNIFSEIQQLYKDSNGKYFGNWIPINYVLLVTGFKDIIIIILFFNFQLKLYSNYDDYIHLKKNKIETIQNEFGENRFKRFILSFSQTTSKNISSYLIIISILISIIPFYLLLEIKIPSSSINYIFKYSFYIPSLSQININLKNINFYSIVNNYILNNNSIFILYLSYFSTIFFLFHISFVLVLLLFVINKKVLSFNFLSKLLIWLLIITFIDLFFSFILIMSLYNLIDKWDSIFLNPHFKSFTNYFKSKHFFIFDYNNKIKIFLLNRNEIVSIYLISSVTFSVLSLIFFHKIKIMDKKKN